MGAGGPPYLCQSDTFFFGEPPSDRAIGLGDAGPFVMDVCRRRQQKMSSLEGLLSETDPPFELSCPLSAQAYVYRHPEVECGVCNHGPGGSIKDHILSIPGWLYRWIVL